MVDRGRGQFKERKQCQAVSRVKQLCASSGEQGASYTRERATIADIAVETLH